MRDIDHNSTYIHLNPQIYDRFELSLLRVEGGCGKLRLSGLRPKTSRGGELELEKSRRRDD